MGGPLLTRPGRERPNWGLGDIKHISLERTSNVFQVSNLNSYTAAFWSLGRSWNGAFF
jgi:hypothetical protein